MYTRRSNKDDSVSDSSRMSGINYVLSYHPEKEHEKATQSLDSSIILSCDLHADRLAGQSRPKRKRTLIPAD